jgi:hypothetical protein
MSFTILVTCENIGGVEFKNYEGIVTLEKVQNVDIDSYNIEALVEMIGQDRVLDAIGREAVIKYFDIEEKDE